MDSLIEQLKAMQEQIAALMERLQIASKAEEAARLEAQSAEAGFWDDAEEAQRIMQRIARLKAEVDKWQSIAQRIADGLELAQLGSDIQDDLSAEVAEIAQIVSKMALEAMLSGEYDRENAILSIHAGAGGTEACDWALMLERMYLRWIEQNGYKVEILDRTEGEEAGIKSVTMSVKGDFAYGYLRSEQGTHRLVRISPFDASARRHTSFAKVELWPDIETDIDVEINEKDLRIDVFRASGAGGQHVQKNETAIRITHLPTGIVVQCQNQRSQLQNRERAMQILKARLYDLERQAQMNELQALKGASVDASFGNQIRSYVLHPYQLVKDHRTNYEVGNAAAVLDGRLNDFMEQFLRARISEQS
ncbi:MAG: peptide chain release factor 2 [Anaerolineae bacterium]|nr:peptide chain release factor 2 [Anaerolineae bacterium]MDW8170969.1 peptide chain release factor 2 [Anaerolineae bacterium]